MKNYVGIDLGGTNIAVGVVNSAQEIVAREAVSTQAGRKVEEVVCDIAKAAKAATKRAGLELEEIAHVGIGVPSTIHPVSKHIAFANNLNWRDLDFISLFRQSWDVPIYLGNDADCAALAEVRIGAAKSYNDVLMLTLGTGVGGSIIIDKNIYLGGAGMGCEPGHATLVYNGVMCTCGRRGCLEAYASATGLIRQSIDEMKLNPASLMWQICENDIRKVNGKTPFLAAKQGDKVAQEVVRQYIDYLANGISGYINALRPEAVILGGGLSHEGEGLFVPLRKRTEELTYAVAQMGMPPILQAKLGNEAGILGAALLGCG